MSTSTRDHCTLNPGVLSNEFYDIDIMENKIADLCYQIRLSRFILIVSYSIYIFILMYLLFTRLLDQS